ncbi:MAG: hypothetical protein ABSF22_12395 [Bryobacteraceae bacterium]
MGVSNIETAFLDAWGDYTGSGEISFAASAVTMQCTLSTVIHSYGHAAGILQYQTQNEFFGPTTHSFAGDPWEIPNSIFDENVISVTFYITVWDDEFGNAAGVGSVFFQD